MKGWCCYWFVSVCVWILTLDSISYSLHRCSLWSGVTGRGSLSGGGTTVHDGLNLKMSDFFCFEVCFIGFVRHAFSRCCVFGVSTDLKCSTRHSLPPGTTLGQAGGIEKKPATSEHTFWNEAALKFPEPAAAPERLSPVIVLYFGQTSKCRTGQCSSKRRRESVGAYAASQMFFTLCSTARPAWLPKKKWGKKRCLLL